MQSHRYVTCCSGLFLMMFVSATFGLVAQDAGVPVVREVFLEKLKLPYEEVQRLMVEKRFAPASDGALQRAAAAAADSKVSADPLPESEVHALINPTDPANIVVSAMRLNNRNQQEVLLCPVYYSKDFGVTWNKSAFKNLPRETGAVVLGGGDPVFAADANGRLYFSWINVYMQNFSRLVMAMFWAWSDDGGATWQRAANDMIGSGLLNGSGGGVEAFDKQWLAVDRTNSPYRNTLYAAMFHPDAGGVKVAVRRKPADSAAFIQTSVRVSQQGYKFTQFPSIGIDASGGVHVTYFASQDSSTFAMYHALSTDGAQSFTEPVKISDVNMPRFSLNDRTGTVPGFQDSRIYPCPHLVIDRSNGVRSGFLYAVWAGNGITAKGADGLDIYLSRSTDNGASWSAPRVVNDDPRGVAVDQFHPSLAVNDAGILAVTWYDRREDPLNKAGRYYYAASTDGGLTFAPNRPAADLPMDFTRAGSANGGFAVGEYNQVLMTNDFVIPVWADGRAGDGNLDVLVSFIPMNAATHVQRITSVTDRFALGDPAPHPLLRNGSVALRLAESTPVRLVLTDLLGRELRVITDAAYDAGTHTISLDVSSLAPGSYRLLVRTRFGVAVRGIVKT
ncbi:MAG: exo-alpha-sialidase [Ignavibacteriae bacterium]|nr:exo-alpha-sialidase [Ignavibacteriota bacterium]